MRRKNPINYEKNPDLTNELEKYLKSRVIEIFSNEINEDYFDYLKLITSTEYKETKEK